MPQLPPPVGGPAYNGVLEISVAEESFEVLRDHTVLHLAEHNVVLSLNYTKALE